MDPTGRAIAVARRRSRELRRRYAKLRRRIAGAAPTRTWARLALITGVAVALGAAVGLLAGATIAGVIAGAAAAVVWGLGGRAAARQDRIDAQLRAWAI